jgi:hypothetical protein
MRKLWAAALALLSALAFLLVGSPPANAFGSEVLGCDAGAGWGTPTCTTYGTEPYGTRVYIDFSTHNTSGTYTTSWTLTGGGGASITQNCSSTSTLPCIYSGCTTSSLDCVIAWNVGWRDKTANATLTLIQSGHGRTLTAQATIYEALY